MAGQRRAARAVPARGPVRLPRTGEGKIDMIRCVRLWTGADENSHFEEGMIELHSGPHGDVSSGKLGATSVSFEETAPAGKLAWHTAPVRQLVVTLSGTLDFETRSGQHFMLRP